MPKISSPWHDMFGDYYDNAWKRIVKIRNRDKKFSVPYVEDEDNVCWQVEQTQNNEFIYTGEIKLRDILYRLQYFAHFNNNITNIAKPCTITMNILGKKTKFKLEESKYKKNRRGWQKSKWKKKQRGWQILVCNADGSYPTYENIMKSLGTIDSEKLAKAILHALKTPLDTQKMFELDGYPDIDVHNVRMFILLTHIAEAAVPSVPALEQYLNLVDDYDGQTELKPKHGRTPMMDKIVRAKLRKIADGAKFSTEFSKKAFQSQVKDGGTNMSRIYALEGRETNTLSDMEDEPDLKYQTEVETNPSGEIQDSHDPSSDIEGETGSSNDTDDLANSLRRMNVAAAKNN